MNISVKPFVMGGEKEAALKPLEEAAEAFGAWQDVQGYVPDCAACDLEVTGCKYHDGFCSVCLRRLADEIADTIQAACNLAARYDIDLEAAMRRCELRNVNRGRYAEV